MERPRSGTGRTSCCRRAHRPQRADHTTSQIGHNTAPNRFSRLLRTADLSRNRRLIPRGTGSSNSAPSSEEFCELLVPPETKRIESEQFPPGRREGKLDLARRNLGAKPVFWVKESRRKLMGRAFEGDTAHRRSSIFEDAIGAVLNGTAIRGLSSCSGGTSPKAPGGSNDAVVERAPRKRDRRARADSGRDREGI